MNLKGEGALERREKKQVKGKRSNQVRDKERHRKDIYSLTIKAERAEINCWPSRLCQLESADTRTVVCAPLRTD